MTIDICTSTPAAGGIGSAQMARLVTTNPVYNPPAGIGYSLPEGPSGDLIPIFPGVDTGDQLYGIVDAAYRKLMSVGEGFDPLLEPGDSRTPKVWTVRSSCPSIEHSRQWSVQSADTVKDSTRAPQHVAVSRPVDSYGMRAVAALGLATFLHAAMPVAVHMDAPSSKLHEETLVLTAEAATIAALGGRRIWREIEKFQKQNERVRAIAIVRQLMLAIVAAHSSHRELPPLEPSRSEDGAFMVEWRFPDRRLGVAFEAAFDESGWYLVDLRPGHELQACGSLEDMDVEKLVHTIARA